MTALEILLVDDDSVARKVMGAMLKRANLAVRYASSGAGALAFLESHSVALVLMDCSMPELDGFETTHRIIELLGANAPPVVGLSAGLLGDDARGRAAGMHQFLHKPVSAKLLEECILLILQSRKGPPGGTDGAIENGTKRPASASALKCFEDGEPQAEHAVFDRARAAAALGGDEVLLREIVAVFMSVSSTYLDNITRAVRSERLKETAQSAHMMNSAARSISAHELSALVDSLETAAQKAQATDLDDRLTQIQSAYARLVPQLQRLLDET